jgi:diacylglycerol kinase family enzyme
MAAETSSQHQPSAATATGHIVIIANPTSGAKAAPDLATHAIALLKSAGRNAELRLTTAPGDAHRLAKDAVAQGADIVVACGGFARALGLNKRDGAEKLVRVLTQGQRRKIDLGAAGSKRFLTVATLGFDSEVDRYVGERKMWLKGTPAYVYGAVRVLARFQYADRSRRPSR